MAMVVLAVMGALTAVAVRWRSDRLVFGACLGLIAAFIVPLYMFAEVPLQIQVVAALLANWRALLFSIAMAILIYGGTGLLVTLYVDFSHDIRPVKVVFSCALGAIASGLSFNIYAHVAVPGVQIRYADLAEALALGALVGLVASFAMTHKRPRDCSFFESRDGVTIICALLGSAISAGGVKILMQTLPGPADMRDLLFKMIAGGLLGAGLTIPLRAVKAGRLAHAVIGSAMGCVVLAAAIRAPGGIPALTGLVAGAAVGFLFPEDICTPEDDAQCEPEDQSFPAASP